MSDKKVDWKIELLHEPNRYGFGKDWTLRLTDGGEIKNLWLGQDAKVTARLFSMDFRFAVDHYTKKAGSKDFDKVAPLIAEDIVRTACGLEADEPVHVENVRELMKLESWQLSAE